MVRGAVWSPPIPPGAVAVQEWRRLDRRTRRELRRGGAPHSDAVTAAVAVGYARTMRRRRGGLRTLRPMLWVVVVAVLAVLPAALGAGPAVPSWAIGCAVVLVT